MNNLNLIALRVLSIEAVPAPALLHLNDYGRMMPLAGYAWLYRYDDQSRWVLIDTGIEDLEAMNLGRQPRQRWSAHPVRDQLARYSIGVDDIGDVILTHLHSDHCGAIDLFTDARWHVPAKEWAFVCDSANKDLVPEPLFSRRVIEQMRGHGVHLLHDGDRPIHGLRTIHMGGHSVGSMAVEIYDQTGELSVVLAGDVVPLYENLTRQIPPGTLWHWAECVRALKRLAGFGVPVLPSHDPQLLSHYPEGVILGG